MRASVANALALYGVLVGLWLALAGLAPARGLTRWEALLGAPAAVTLACWWFGLLSGPAWAGRGAALAEFWGRCLRGVYEGGLAVAGAILGRRHALRPALVLHPTAAEDPARGLFALGASMAPGVVAVALDPNGVLIHTIHDDEADDDDLRALQAAARRVGGA